MKRDDDQELWDLLGRTPPPPLSPFFSRNVVRRVRNARAWPDFASWFTPRNLVPAAAVALILSLAALSIQVTPNEEATDNLPDFIGAIDPQDYEVVADLDDLLAAEGDSVWDESDSLSL